MKRAHIVYCHPEPRSFVAAMRDIVEGALQRSEWQTSLTDLTATNFNPVASAGDFAERARPDYLTYAIEQRHAWETRSLDPQLSAEVRLALESDLLVLVFPIFWFSMPAQMKGWIDRVFLSGQFYGGKRIYDRGGMLGKRAMVVASLGGREHMFGHGSVHGDLKGMLRHLLQGTLGYVGYSVLEPYFAHHVPYVDADARAQMLTRLWAEMEQVETRASLAMPEMDRFDDQFRPREPGLSS